MSQTVRRMLIASLTAALLLPAAGGTAEPPHRKAAHPAAEAQQVIPPKTVYWLSASTQNGFGLGGKPPSTGDLMKMAMGGGRGGAQKLLSLDLGSSLPPAGPPQASHLIPPTMNMGKALALRSPRPVVASQAPSRQPEPEEHRDYERPKGRILLFWGCGETAHANQPVVFDFSKIAAGQPPPNLFVGEAIRVANPPSAATWPTFGFWPNDDRGSRQSVPADASLVGAHRVAGNYTPDISFTLDQDWMGALNLVQTKLPSGALQLEWNGLPEATGHFVQLMGAARNAEGGSDVVFWSSSETQTFLSGLSDYIPPGEAARLVERRRLLPPSQTRCAVPKEVMTAVQGGLISLVAHGPEQDIVFPPRPQDPHTPWVQEWAVKARYVSRTGAMAGMNMPAGAHGDAARCAQRPSTGSLIGGALGGSLGGALGGMLSKPAKPEGCP